MKNGEKRLDCTITIKDLKKEEPIPYELLLQADPSRERIDSYIKLARCRVAQTAEETIGVCVVLAKTFDDEETSKSKESEEGEEGEESEEGEDTADIEESDNLHGTNVTYETAEIMNIAIAEKFQGQGYGKALVLDAIEIIRTSKIKTLQVGTGNSSIAQLGFYQKCGFRITGIDFDFFTRNYPEEIIENGIVCRDLIKMSMTI
jgi:ribosomal protein S18 acetylase RimI-like enzyme